VNGRIVVGYTANDSGADALALGTRIARASDAILDVVMVLPSEAHNSTVPTDTGYERYLKGQSREWLAEASESLDDDDEVVQSLHVRYAESFAEGLITAAHEFGASLIVVGAARGGLLGRSRIGSVGNELLHSSDVPVALAPVGSRDVPVTQGVTRVTAAIGTREGLPGGKSMSITARPTCRGCPSVGWVCMRKPGPALTSTIAPRCSRTERAMSGVMKSMPATSSPTTIAACRAISTLSG